MDYGQPVKFGVFITPGAAQPEHPLAVAALADELGFDLVGVQDHPYQSRFLDTWTLLTAMAMRTKQIKVFSDVLNIPLRPPAVLAKAIQGTRLMWSGERGVRFDGSHYQLSGVHTGPPPAHPIGIWLGAYKPRMLSLVGRAADGWVPSLGYAQPADLHEGNMRIDEAAGAAGRDPKAIRRILNAGADVPVELFTSLTVEHGMDTYVIGGIEDPEALRWFATDAIPAGRDAG